MEERVDELEKLVGDLRNARSAQPLPTPIPAPPIQTNPYASVRKWAIEEAMPPSPIPEVHKAPKDAEYQFGAQWLPRIGAALLVLGIAFLIGLGVTKGWITPPMLFGGAVALCLSFVLGGFFFRNEREDFGQVLMGIGSCGLFATLAGGHVYQNLYSGEVLVSTFILWSLANLGYALVRKSRAFLAIGIVGGFIGAVMPVSKQAFELTLILNAAVLVASAAVVVRHKFSTEALGVWIASGLAMLPALFEQELPWQLRVGAVYGATLICILAHLLARDANSKAPETQALAAVMMGVAALFAFDIAGGTDGILHTLLAAAACGLLALIFRNDHPVRNVFAWLGVGLATFLAPWGLQMAQAVIFMAALAVASAGLAGVVKRPEIGHFTVLQITVAGFAYIHAMFEGRFPNQGMEALAVGLITMACGILAWAIGKQEDDARLLAVFAVGWAGISRLGLLLAEPNDLRLASFGVTASWILLGGALLTAGFLGALRNYRYAGVGVLLCAVGKVLAVDLATATPELRVAVLIAVGLALLAGGYAYIRKRTDRFA